MNPLLTEIEQLNRKRVNEEIILACNRVMLETLDKIDESGSDHGINSIRYLTQLDNARGVARLLEIDRQYQETLVEYARSVGKQGVTI